LLCEILPKLRPDIVIQRLFGLSDLDMLIAPNWNLKKSQIQHFIDAEIEKRGVIQGSEYSKKKHFCKYFFVKLLFYAFAHPF
jgi:radical SAM superfamily enzyme